MEKKSEFYNIRNKNLAITISYLLGENFFTFDAEDGHKVYTFKDSPRFKEVLTEVTNRKKAISK